MRTCSKSYPNNSNATIPRRQNRKRVPNIVEPEIHTIEDVVPMAGRTMEELLQAPTEGVNTNSRESSSKTDDRIDKLTDQISNLVKIVNKQVITPATVKAVKKSCVICGGSHAYYDCIATVSNQSSVCAATGTYNQVYLPNRASNQMTPPGFAPVQNNQNRYNQNQGQGNNFNRGNNFQGNQGYRAPMNHAPNFQNQPFQAPNNHVQQGIPNEFLNYIKSNESLIRNMQNQINVLRGDFNKQEENIRRNLNNHMRSILGSFFQNQASTSGTLPSNTISSNTIPNPKGEIKAVTTRSGLAYEGPSIPTYSSPEKVVERETEKTTNKEQPNCQGSTAHIQPPVVPTPILEPVVLKTQPKPNIPYPSRLNDQKLREKAMNQMEKRLAKVPLNENCSAMLLKKLPENLGDLGKFLIPYFEADPRVPLIIGRSFLRTGHALIDVYGEEITLLVNDESVTFNRNQTMRYSSTYDDNSVNRIDVIDIGCEEYAHDVLILKPNVKSSSPTLTPFGESDFLLEEIEDFLKDESIPMGIEDSCYDPDGDILYLKKLLNDDPSQLPSMDLKQVEETKVKSSIEEPLELELKELPSHLEYAFLEETNKLPVIIPKDLKEDEKEALLKVLKSHKRAIAWRITDIKGIDPRFCTHKILMEEDYKPAVQSQRRVNPKIHEVIKKEVIKLLDAGMIYPISDSPWVSPVHCVPKKGGMTVVVNENNELIPTRLVTGWRVCIDYRKLNDATRKDHFLLLFMDQMLERLAENEFYCFLDGF
nr:reverse transcriptase domain-containing protein [Tanacetum cinerariifolium]